MILPDSKEEYMKCLVKGRCPVSLWYDEDSGDNNENEFDDFNEWLLKNWDWLEEFITESSYVSYSSNIIYIEFVGGEHHIITKNEDHYSSIHEKCRSLVGLKKNEIPNK